MSDISGGGLTLIFITEELEEYLEERYGEVINMDDVRDGKLEFRATTPSYEVFLNIRKPLEYDHKGKVWGAAGVALPENKIKEAKESGEYDGVIVKNIVEGGLMVTLPNGEDVPPCTDYIVLKPNQIKSATDNRGTFDAKSDRIDYSLEGDEQVLEPIEIEFEEQEGVNWRVAASEYIRDVLAGRVFDMPDGYRVAIPKGRNSRDRMVKGVRTQKRYEVIKGVERLFSVVRLLKEEEGQHKLIEGKKRRELVDKANSYNVFGYPLLINGELHYGWFGAFNFDKDAPKDVVFYEFGVKEEDGFTGLAVGHDENHEVRPQLNPSSSEVTLGDLKRIVNGNNEGSEFSLEEAKGLGLIENGVGVFANAVVVEPGTDFNIDALHASPHLFPKFDTAFMGSGEGAQVYGWGLYFATRYGVNEWYFRNFNKNETVVKIDGKSLYDAVAGASGDSLLWRTYYLCSGSYTKFANDLFNEVHHSGWKDRLVEQYKKRIVDCKEKLGSDLSDYNREREKSTLLYNEEILEYYRNLEKIVASHDVQAVKQGAINYKVTLKVEDDELLMWDEHITDCLRGKPDVYRQANMVASEEMRKYNDGWLTGGSLYKALSDALGSPKAASEWLLERGVKGVEYADGGSRGRGGKKYYNYVMFSGDDVVIEKIDRRGAWNVDFDKWENPDDVFGETNLSLLGEHAKTFWEYDESRMFKGRDDGRLRVEIDSSVAGVKEKWRDNRSALPGGTSMGEVFDFPELYEGYPELKDIEVFVRNLGSFHGCYYPDEKVIELDEEFLRTSSNDEIKSTILHELGHAVQDIEGWVLGWSGEVGLKSHGPEGSNFSVDEGEVVTRWVSELRGYLGRKIESGSPAHTRDIVVCPAPAVLQMTLKNRYDVVITGGVIDKVMWGRHAVSQGEMEQLPMAIADPIGIMKSNTVGSVEILTVLKEGDKNILVAIAVGVNARGRKGVVNRITSLYGKDKIDELLKHKALYWNKGKARYALSGYRLQLPAAALVMRASGKNVPDKVDLVKYKKENGFNFSLETREPGTNYCIIGEGSEIFREYEEAGLVYVDKADGKKKAILDSRGVKLKHGLGGVPKTGAKVTSLGAVLDYPELYRAYPELKKLRVDLFRGEPHLGGYAVKDENYIAVNVEAGTWTSPLVTILHEVQHIIQGAEGFARGASGSMDKKSAIEYIEKSLEQLRERKDNWAKEQVEKLEVMKADIENPDGTIKPFFVYMVSHGEREADMVGTIMGTNSVGVNMTGADATEYMRLQEYSIPVIGDITPLGGVTFSAGRFGAMGHERLSAMGDKLYDEQVLKMRRAVERSARRLAQFKEKGEENNGRELLLEATEMITAVQDMLPHSYGFSLEPYKVWLAIFSKLYGYDGRGFSWEEINKALDMLPQTSAKGFGTWHTIMNFSIMKNFKKWLKVAHEDVFFETHEEIKDMMAQKNTTPGEPDVPVEEDLAPEAEEAEIWMRVFEEYASEFLPAYGEVKVMAMMGKFMDRVAKQLDRYRKDVLLGRIRRVVDGVKVRKGKDGKPVKGKMTAEYYETLDKLMSLIELSEGQYEAVVEKYKEEEKEWEELDEDMMLSVDVYNRNGDKEEIAISKREFDIYACYEEMSAEQADRCARALGEYIATGKQAWQNAEAKRRQDLEEALAMQSVPTSFRQRVELAIQRGESSEENVGELRPSAMNYLLPCGKKVIRYYNGDCTPLELLEEVIELWVKGEVVNGRPKEFFLEGLKESQAYLLGHGGLKDGELLIAENLLFDGKADSELTDLERKMRDKALIEGMSMLAKSVYVGDLTNQKNLPSVVRRFMLYLRAVVEKVMDMLNFAGTFKAGVDAGAINRDFADFVYEACGSDFASARAEAVTYGMEKELREMVEGVNNALAGGDELGLKSHGPVGRDLRVFREDLVRDSDNLAEILKKKQGEIIYNEKLDIKARISGQTKGKAGHARMSVANLKRFGISEKDARIIHYTAAARIDELFKNAEYGFFEYSYKNDTSRKGAYHAFTTIEIEGYGVFDVNISAVQAIQLKDGSFLFTLEATIENPSSNSALLPSSLRGAAGKATGITERILSAYRSFVEKEMMYIKKNAEKAGVFMKAPNGKNSNLSERLWCVVRTKAFKGWFGDWENAPENASKVVDENGEPMVMYHGSPTRGIKVFEMNEALFGEGAFFTNVAEEALDYTGLELLDYKDVGEMDEAAVEQGLLYEVFLNIRDEDRVYERNGGIHARAISPNEIKSATDNRGTFDVGSLDITMALVDGSIRGELEAGLVNASEYVADYWGKVDARLGKELESIEKLLSYIKDDMRSRNNKKWLQELKKKREAEVERLYKEKEWLDGKSQRGARELYFQLAGEIESRAIERRMEMSMEKRMAKPFSESLDIPAEDTIVYTGLGGDLKPSMSYGSEFSVDEGLREVLSQVWQNRYGEKRLARLCSLPPVLKNLGETGDSIMALGRDLGKLKKKHKLSEQKVYEIVKSLENPLYVIKDSNSSYIFGVKIEAMNKKGEISPVMAAISMDKSRGVLMLSAYALNDLQKIESQFKQGHLVYSKYRKDVLLNYIQGSHGRPIDDVPNSLMGFELVRSMARHGFKGRVLTEADIVKGENRERENETNFCIIGEGSEIFREYEEAGLVYVDKADGKKKAILDNRGGLINKKRSREVAIAGVGEEDDDIFTDIGRASGYFSGGG